MTGNQLKFELKKLNVTQEEAADRLGVTRRTLQNWFSLDELDANISQNVKSVLGIGNCDSGSTIDVNSLIEANRQLSEIINRQSKIIETLTSKIL